MSHNFSLLQRHDNNRGFGLVAAIFVVVILALFGLLIVRYTSTGSISSIEDHLWAQALYSADSGAQLSVLYRDGGGTGAFTFPITVEQFTVTGSDDFTLPINPTILHVQASRINISRRIEVKYVLQ